MCLQISLCVTISVLLISRPFGDLLIESKDYYWIVHYRWIVFFINYQLSIFVPLYTFSFDFSYTNIACLLPFCIHLPIALVIIILVYFSHLYFFFFLKILFCWVPGWCSGLGLCLWLRS